MHRAALLAGAREAAFVLDGYKWQAVDPFGMRITSTTAHSQFRLNTSHGLLDTRYVQHEVWQHVFADDIKWVVIGPTKYDDLTLAVLLRVIAGTPLIWAKTRGGIQTDWIEYWLDYRTFSVGITEKRLNSIFSWVDTLLFEKKTCPQRFAEGLGKLSFAAGNLE